MLGPSSHGSGCNGTCIYRGHIGTCLLARTAASIASVIPCHHICSHGLKGLTRASMALFSSPVHGSALFVIPYHHSSHGLKGLARASVVFSRSQAAKCMGES